MHCISQCPIIRHSVPQYPQNLSVYLTASHGIPVAWLFRRGARGARLVCYVSLQSPGYASMPLCRLPATAARYRPLTPRRSYGVVLAAYTELQSLGHAYALRVVPPTEPNGVDQTPFKHARYDGILFVVHICILLQFYDLFWLQFFAFVNIISQIKSC